MPIAFFLIIFLLPFLLLLMFLNLATISFARLGLSPIGAMFFLTASVVGGMINIPLSRKQVIVQERRNSFFPSFIFYYPPVVREQVICLNLGGAGLPALFSFYLLLTGKASFLPTLPALLLVTVVTKIISRPQPGVGIVMPAFLPPLFAAAAALLLAPQGQTAPVAYVAGTMGTLIGADLLNWRVIQGLGAQVVSIGGAGIFDGIFLVGLLAAFLG